MVAVYYVWRIVGTLAGLGALATVVALASHFTPIIVHTGEDGAPSAVQASWDLIATAGGATVGLLTVTLLLFLALDR